MTCPIHGEIKGFACKQCFQDKEERLALQRFLTFPNSTYKTVSRKDKWHAVIPGYGNKTLCGTVLHSGNDLGVPILRTEPPPRKLVNGQEKIVPFVTCADCIKIGWPG